MKLVRLAIFLTGITGLAMGGMMSLSSLRSGQEQAQLKVNDSLKAQATQFVDQFYGVLEATKNINASSTNIPSYVTYRAVAKVNQKAPSEFESFASTDTSNPNANATETDFALQERVMNALKANISLPELQINRIAYGTYSLTDVGNKEGIYLATPIFKVEKGITDPNTIEKINVVMIDPVKAFGGLEKISTSSNASAYLFTRKGKVLAHTVAAYVGTDLKQVPTLKDTIDNLFLGAQTGSAFKYKNVDGEEEQIAIVRAGTSPFAFAVEERASAPVMSGAWVSDQIDSGAARRNVGVCFVMIAVALGMFSGISIWASKQLNRQVTENANAREADASLAPSDVAPMVASAAASASAAAIAAGIGAPPKIAPSLLQAQAVEVPSSNVSETAAALHEAREQIAREQERMNEAVQVLASPQDYVKAFEERIEKCYALEAVEKELVGIASEVTESPVMYFRYHRRNQNLSLAAASANVKVPNYSVMQAYVRKDIELQVEQMADHGKVASVSNYGPISKLLISHLNTAHFEAWGVTSHPEVSGQAKLVGVIVVLQSVTQNAQARPILARILKSAGNYLYAQSNKLRPRASLYANDATAPASSESSS